MFSASKLVAVLALAGFAAASPVPALARDFSLDELAELEARGDSTCINPLNIPWNDSITTCPHTNAINSAGECWAGMQVSKSDSYCLSYCEMRNYWFPGPEAPFSNSGCESGDSCSLAQAKATSVTNGFSINLGFTGNSPKIGSGDATAAFNLGASYSYTVTTTYTTTVTHDRPSNATSNCGYWTFVPYYVASCGTMTTTDYSEVAFVGGYDMQCGTKSTGNTPNWCNSTPLTIGGQAQGQVVFVNTQCNGGGLLPMDQQDYIYQQKGVSSGVAAESARMI